MDLNRLTRDADDLIRKVVSRYNQLYVPAGTISQLELDLMLDDLRKLYETFKHIGHVNLTLQDTANKPEVSVNTAIYSEPQHPFTSTQAGSKNTPPTPEPMPVATLPEPEIVASAEVVTESIPEPEDGLDLEKNAEFVTEPEYETEPVNNNPIQSSTEAPEMEKPVQIMPEESNPVLSPESSHATLADKFNTSNKSLSETMAASQTQAAIGSRLQFQPIADLNTGIGLNDKFSFISDLFTNNVVQYDEAIHRINKAVNLDEANWILQKYHTADWDHKQETLARMKDFVKRRFI